MIEIKLLVDEIDYDSLVDVLVPAQEKGDHPVIAWPGECWYCGACVLECPVEGAIRLEHPLMNRTKFVDAIPEPASDR